MKPPVLRSEPGWFGVFTREAALGAFRNGSTIRKAREEPGDATPLGTQGVVLGSIAHGGRVGYFVEWENRPRIAVGVVAWKIELVV